MIDEEEFYKSLSVYEKLTMILTTSLNDTLNGVSFGIYTRIVLAIRKEKKISFYIWNNGYEVGRYDKDLDQTIRYTEDDIIYFINSIYAKTNDSENEDIRCIPMASAKKLGQMDGDELYIVPTAVSDGFPKGLLWQKIYEFFVEKWNEIIEDQQQYPLFDYSSPEQVLDNLYYEWSPVTVPCCRALSEGGFYTGYGDPYESEFLFELLNNVSSLNYEKRTSRGSIVAIPDEIADQYDLFVRFVDEIPLDEKLAKTYRKLLEMASDGVALALGNFRVLGLIDASVFDWKIVMYGSGKWKYYYKDQVIFTVENSRVIIGKEAAQVKYHLPEDKEDAVSNPVVVETIVQEAMKQDHGTCVLFTDNAIGEVERLAQFRRCIRIDPVNLSDNTEMILPLTAIDGAIIVDFDGNCYGVGAILDGEAQCAGDFGRGARFNSAINYIGWKKEKDNEHEYCAVVVSEDGIHDIIAKNTLDSLLEDLGYPFISNG